MNEPKTKLTRDTLAELQAQNLPHMTAKDIAAPKESGRAADAVMARLDEYLQAFVRPAEDGKCVLCGQQQGAKDILDGLLNARFKWGLAHGEGFCSVCGYPGRAIHHIGKGTDEIIIQNLILQYHPSGLSFEKR